MPAPSFCIPWAALFAEIAVPFMAIGYVVMKVVEGEIDVGEMIDRNRRTRQ